MTDERTTIGELKRRVLDFSRERDWEQFHRPKDLGLALAIEVGEVLEHFRYLDDAAIRAALDDPHRRRELGHVCRIDLAAALAEKVDLAALKYPVDRSFGRPDKYTAYQDGPAPPG